MTTLTLPGKHLGPAWLNTALAASDDDNRPVLFRSVLVEVFDHGVQLISTDSYMLLGTFVPRAEEDLTPPPAMDEAPNETYVVCDADRRMQGLMRHVIAEAKTAEKHGYACDVTLEVRSAEHPEVPTLDPSMDRAVFVVHTERERLVLPIYEGEFPTWRKLLDVGTDAVEQVALSPMLLGRFGKLKAFAGAICFDFDGSDGLISISTTDESYLFGGLMPVRV